MKQASHDHDHDHDHGHEHGGGSPWAHVRHAVGLHSHSHDSVVDEVLQGSAEGMRTLWISLAVLGATAIAQEIGRAHV